MIKKRHNPLAMVNNTRKERAKDELDLIKIIVSDQPNLKDRILKILKKHMARKKER